jgi:O-antigen/teichoic acid export membrane protein
VTAAVGSIVPQRETLAGAQRAALTVFAIRIGGAGLAYATQVLLARFMGQTEYGVFALAWVWIAILGHGCLWGVAQSVCRFVPHHRARGELDLVRGFLRGGAMHALASGLLTAAIGATALWLCAASLDGSHLWAFAFALAVLPLFAVQDYVEGVARSFAWIGLAIAPLYVLRQGLIAVVFVAAVAMGVRAEAWVALAAALAAVFVALGLQGSLVLRRVRDALPAGPRQYRIGMWASASLPIALVDLTTLGLSYIDVLLLGFFLAPEAVGVYFAATRILQFVVFAQYAASAATAQRFADAEARGDRATLAALVTRTARLTAGLTLATGAGVLAAAPLLLALFGPAFSGSLPVLGILIGGVVLQSAFGPAEDLLNMLGQERACALASGLVLGVAALLNCVLIPRFGVTGAAAAMAVAAACRGIALSLLASRRLGVTTTVLGRAGR